MVERSRFHVEPDPHIRCATTRCDRLGVRPDPHLRIVPRWTHRRTRGSGNWTRQRRTTPVDRNDQGLRRPADVGLRRCWHRPAPADNHRQPPTLQRYPIDLAGSSPGRVSIEADVDGLSSPDRRMPDLTELETSVFPVEHPVRSERRVPAGATIIDRRAPPAMFHMKPMTPVVAPTSSPPPGRVGRRRVTRPRILSGSTWHTARTQRLPSSRREPW